MSTMVERSLSSVMLLLLSYLISESLCANYRLLQDVSNVEAITARLANAIVHVGRTHFSENGPVFLVVPSKKDKFFISEIIEGILQNISGLLSVLVVEELLYGVTVEHTPFFERSSYEVNSFQTPNLYIIPMTEEKDIKIQVGVLKTLSLFPLFNPRGMFFLVKTIVECGNFSQYNVTSHYFAEFWKKNCMTVILLVISECDLKLTVVSGTPFSNKNPCRTPEPGGLRYRQYSSSDYLIELDISKTKVRNFNGCLFLAGAIPSPPFVVAKKVRNDSQLQYSFVGGMEMEITDVISNKFNLTVKMDVSNGYDINSILTKFSNGTEVGIAADMKNHKIDFALGGVSPNYRSFFMFDFSSTYKYSSFSWYLADAHIAPRWQIIFKALSPDVWISSAALFLLVSLLYFAMELHNYKIRKTIKFSVSSITVIDLLCVGLGLSAMQHPRGCLKVLFFSWAAFGLHWSIAYSSTLFGLLKTPPHEKEIMTIQDLKDSGFKVLSPTLYFQLFTGVDIDSVTRSVLNNKIECINLNVCIKRFVTQRNVSLMARTEYVDYSINYKVSKIHKLSENLISFGVNFMTNKGNPLSLVINEVVFQAFETGLVRKWETETAWKFNYEKNTLETYSDDNSIPLSVEILQGAFLLLVVGLLVSLLVFLGEVLIYLYKK